jgi:hypothetical protein
VATATTLYLVFVQFAKRLVLRHVANAAPR